MKSPFCRRNLFIYYISICLICLGTLFYQPKIASAKMVNKSEASQKIDLETVNPNQQEKHQLEELKARGEALGPLSTEMTIIFGVVVVIFLAGLIYQENKK